MKLKASKTVLFLLYLLLTALACAHAEKYCPTCHRHFPDASIYCPYDRTKLVTVNAAPGPSVHHAAIRRPRPRSPRLAQQDARPGVRRPARVRAIQRIRVTGAGAVTTAGLSVGGRRRSGPVAPGGLTDLSVISNDLIWVRRYEQASTGPDSMEAKTADGIVRKVEPRLRRISRAHPHNAAVHRLLGQVYYYEGRASASEKEFNRALQLAPWNAESRDGLGRVYLQQDRPDAAETQFRRATTLRPRDSYFWTDLATALSKQGRYAEADQAGKTAIQYGAPPLIVRRIKVTR